MKYTQLLARPIWVVVQRSYEGDHTIATFLDKSIADEFMTLCEDYECGHRHSSDDEKEWVRNAPHPGMQPWLRPGDIDMYEEILYA